MRDSTFVLRNIDFDANVNRQFGFLMLGGVGCDAMYQQIRWVMRLAQEERRMQVLAGRKSESTETLQG